uniref:Enoyl reductase (ER) domain-containing protein n=1 Tax=Globisporangium ultimum (strain ATCC 200006 / CBS 805.95 / DAOM BR144) TaxID=431595 RepID=K3WC02_GLOUD
MIPIAVPRTFKQWQYANFGAFDREWKLAETTAEPLDSSHVRIQTKFAALNPIDYKLAQYGAHSYQRTPTEAAPFVVGFDAAGIVVEVGADISEFHVGDEVYMCTPIEAFGSIAEYFTVDAKYVAPKPKNLDFKNAAGVPLACLTSYQSLFAYGKVVASERVVVLGGSSSCGMFAVQLAKAVGAHVVATSSTRNFELVKSLGADKSWNNEAQTMLKKGTGRFVTLSHNFAQDPVDSPIGAKLISIFCVASGADLCEITALIEKGQVRSVVDSVFPMDKLIEATSKLQKGSLSGKVIIEVAKE